VRRQSRTTRCADTEQTFHRVGIGISTSSLPVFATRVCNDVISDFNATVMTAASLIKGGSVFGSVLICVCSSLLTPSLCEGWGGLSGSAT